MKSFPQCSSSHFLNSQGWCSRWDLNKVFTGTCYTECVQLCTQSCWFFFKPISNLSECLIKSWQAVICIPELYITMYVLIGISKLRWRDLKQRQMTQIVFLHKSCQSANQLISTGRASFTSITIWEKEKEDIWSKLENPKNWNHSKLY